MCLGHQLALPQAGEQRRMVALNLPCRDFAALFIVAGLVSARLARRLTQDEQALQLEMLCSLPVGAGVEIWQGEKRQRGTIAGLGLAYQNECITVDVSLSRRFTSSTSVEPTTDFSLSVGLLGFGNGTQAGPARVCRR